MRPGDVALWNISRSIGDVQPRVVGCLPHDHRNGGPVWSVAGKFGVAGLLVGPDLACQVQLRCVRRQWADIAKRRIELQRSVGKRLAQEIGKLVPFGFRTDLRHLR